MKSIIFKNINSRRPKYLRIFVISSFKKKRGGGVVKEEPK
jgi:hypothetical protein